MIFGRRKPTVAVEIRTDRAEYRPGDIVRATVRLTPSADLDSPEIAVALQHTDTVTDGSAWTDAWAVDGRYVVAETPMRGGVTVEHRVDLRVPERTGPFDDIDDDPVSDDPEDYRYDILRSEVWGAPTSAGPRIRSAWAVHVSGSGTGRPLDEHHPVTVLAPPGPGGGPSRPRGESAELADITLEIPDRSVPAGGTVGGRLRVSARTALDARALRVDLLLVERREDRVLTADRRAEVVLSGPQQLAAGTHRDLPFVIAVPAGAPPTVVTEVGTVEWVLHGVVDLPRREDAVGVRPVVVHSPRA